MKTKIMARPTKYKKEYNEQAYELCLLGFTDKELAEFFGVVESTINDWKKKHKEFSKSVNAGKEIADGKVAKSFYKRACGYSYDEITQEGANGQMTVTKIVTKEVVPDSGAALNWLKNRQPNKWRDKKEMVVKSDVTVNDLSKLTDEELNELERITSKLERNTGREGKA